jgi:hypothetical protein
MVAEFERAIKYPFNLKPLLILGILFVIPFILFFILLFSMDMQAGGTVMTSETALPIALSFLSFMGLFFIVFVLLYGYMVRASKSMIAGNLDTAPDLNDIKGLFVDGLKLMVLQFVYTIPPLVIAILPLALINVLGIILIPFYLVLIFILMPAFYFFQLAGAHLAKTDSLKQAMNLPYIYSLMYQNPGDFLLALIFYFAVSLVFSLAAMLIVTYSFVIVASYVAGQYIFTVFYMESTGIKEQ